MGAGEIEFLGREALEDGVSEDGSVTLSWEKEALSVVVLEQAGSKTFETSVVRYEGTDSGSVLTGLSEGTHYFRVGEAGSAEWSKPLAVNVVFVPRDKLFLLLGTGCLVVAATIGTIIVGYFRNRNEGGGE